MTNRLTIGDVKRMFPDTDKARLGYLPAYNGFLPDGIVKVLEIGVWKGDGLRMIKHFYNGEGEYHAMNYVFGDEEGYIPSIETFEKEGIKCHVAYDYDIEAMSKITEKFDVIIEDASHCSDSQIICFKHFFLNNLKEGGVYFMEDLNCCKHDAHWKDIKKFEDTALYLLKNVMGCGTFESLLISKEEDEQLRGAIARINIIGGFSEDSIGVINKAKWT